METLKSEVKKEREQREKLELELAKVEATKNRTSQEKDEQAQAAQSDKEGLTAEVVHLRNKVTSLQVDLDNSVAVQNDFVRLSQSLQVELEKIRQAEKEVGRWSM